MEVGEALAVILGIHYPVINETFSKSKDYRLWMIPNSIVRIQLHPDSAPEQDTQPTYLIDNAKQRICRTNQT